MCMCVFVFVRVIFLINYGLAKLQLKGKYLFDKHFYIKTKKD